MELTKAGDMVGTVDYIAPEQIEGGQIDARTDIYSLGCLFYQCLTGEPPFARETSVASIYAHLSEEPPLVTSVRPELPSGLDAVIARALAKLPTRRFPTCADMMSAARAAIDAAGPLVEGALSPPVPWVGDQADVPTYVGDRRLVPSLGDHSGRATSVGPDAREVDRDAVAVERPRLLLAGLGTSARASARVAAGQRFEVEETQAGESLLDAVRNGRPDLVIVAWDAPGAPASEVVAALRAQADTREAKVLLLVDYAQASRGEVAAAGADDRLSCSVLATAVAGQAAPAPGRRRRGQAHGRGFSRNGLGRRMWLEVLNGEDAGRALELDRPVVLGRVQGADLILRDPRASGRHAELTPVEDGIRLLDLDSSNGTLVDDEPVHEQVLHGGEEIRIGSLRIAVMAKQRVRMPDRAGPGPEPVLVDDRPSRRHGRAARTQADLRGARGRGRSCGVRRGAGAGDQE